MTDMRRSTTALALAALLGLAACASDDEPEAASSATSERSTADASGSASADPSSSGDASASPSGTDAAASPSPDDGAGSSATAEPSATGEGGTPTSLQPGVFAGYATVDEGVVPWIVECPDVLVPEPATAMGTASQPVGRESEARRQVAVFREVAAAVNAGRDLAAQVRACAEPPSDPEDKVDASPLDVGADGALVYGGVDSGFGTAVFRRGTAVGLVDLSVSIRDLDLGPEVLRNSAQDLFDALCVYDEGAAC